MALIASSLTIQQRQAACAACTNRTSVAGVDICSVCGCVLTIKYRIKSSECPLKKWVGA